MQHGRCRSSASAQGRAAANGPMVAGSCARSTLKDAPSLLHFGKLPTVSDNDGAAARDTASTRTWCEGEPPRRAGEANGDAFHGPRSRSDTPRVANNKKRRRSARHIGEHDPSQEGEELDKTPTKRSMRIRTIHATPQKKHGLGSRTNTLHACTPSPHTTRPHT